jgi:hypothetical protein
LATVGLWSSIVSLAATLVLLLAAGPVASLGGILIGELVLAWSISLLATKWKLRHG